MKILVFPGQGSQYSGMGKDWYENFKEAQLTFEEASDFTGLKLRRLCFDGADSDLRATEITQPAILTVTVAIYRSLKAQADIRESDYLFAGHSLGEYSALACLGAIGVGPAARLVKKRGHLMQESVPAGHGSMAAVVFKPKTDGAPRARALCEEISSKYKQNVWVANYNSPEQIVISGEQSAIDLALKLATLAPTEARKIVELQVSAPFHCPLMRPAAEGLGPDLKSAPWRELPDCRYIANVDAQISPIKDVNKITDRLIEQITGSVRWVESIETAIQAGATQAIEIGPGRVLSGLIKRIDSDGVDLDTKNIDTWKDYKDAPLF